METDNPKVDAKKTSKLDEKLKELQTIFEYGYTSSYRFNFGEMLYQDCHYGTVFSDSILVRY